MSDEVSFLPYEEALKLVGAVMEEEHIHEPDRRVLTVYDKNERELCWFDAEEIMAELAAMEGGLPKKEDDLKAKAVELVLHQIPTWAAEQE
ncbi:hypothetical protein [Desulfurivibrio dismutans]|uniref:hypothetical protein n=1 Tax=Desulfurivibrio dismutans TaxID=1398908 RepID=UPI0023DC25FA|nr:hypothetical protein [Desulfurivibrio alkaliphilus]MDF1615180.1 hypothetical protein [Desulfurivibrio alkaliphilus]